MKGRTTMDKFERISHNVGVMGGKACIKGTRITVGTILMQFSEGLTIPEILEEYPHLTEEDIYEALRYAAWTVGTREEVVVMA